MSETSHATPGPWNIGRPGGPQGNYWCLVNQQGMVVAPMVVTEADARLMAQAWRLPMLLVALQRAEAHLSLLRHRAPVPWGDPGIGPEYEYDEVIGLARRVLKDTEASWAAPERG